MEIDGRIAILTKNDRLFAWITIDNRLVTGGIDVGLSDFGSEREASSGNRLHADASQLFNPDGRRLVLIERSDVIEPVRSVGTSERNVVRYRSGWKGGQHS